MCVLGWEPGAEVRPRGTQCPLVDTPASKDAAGLRGIFVGIRKRVPLGKAPCSGQSPS